MKIIVINGYAFIKFDIGLIPIDNPYVIEFLIDKVEGGLLIMGCEIVPRFKEGEYSIEGFTYTTHWNMNKFEATLIKS